MGERSSKNRKDVQIQVIITKAYEAEVLLADAG